MTILTDPQRQVLVMMARGLAQKEIAARLGIDRMAVASRCTRAAAALGARNTIHAVTIALQHRLLTLEEIAPDGCEGLTAR